MLEPEPDPELEPEPEDRMNLCTAEWQPVDGLPGSGEDCVLIGPHGIIYGGRADATLLPPGSTLEHRRSDRARARRFLPQKHQEEN